MNIQLNLNKKNNDEGISNTFAILSLVNEVVKIQQKFNFSPQTDVIVLDFEQADTLREFLNKNLPR